MSARGTVAITNPVHGRNFPDPFVLEVDGRWYGYATEGEVGTLPILRSNDLVTWDVVGEGMPRLAPWSVAGRHWAPEIAAFGTDRYVAYYTAMERVTRNQCIGTAVAASPEGPFEDVAEVPFIGQHDEGGSIDASPFTDVDGTRYLLWKNDGNHIGVDSWVYLQQLSPDGLELVGEPHRLLTHDQAWEGHLVEGPFLWIQDGRYVLFYSANDYASADYGVGYAVADDLLGPYTKPSDEPLMRSTDDAAGPGHGMVVETGGRTWYVHHAWPPDAVGAKVPGRTMWLTELRWTRGVPVLDGPRARVEIASEHA
ncbi:glycoside hydrolase family 43 protein [Occultella kanbiaonis]|uniref:glycoside hydrolase family 43 protein n=1 Tax=Occultella kanbiaonis TaxID=2675754 RepID=UPI00143DD3E8|nr:glycoside hydrolase family 43 protein [Occultella kanbiaonis]